MKTYTKEQLAERFKFPVDATVEKDEKGQLIVYTGVYEWDSDGSFHDYPEEKK